MDVVELKKLLADKTAKRDELPDVEFKESAGSTFFVSICSLANASGGIVVLGVDKHGAIVGVPPSSEYLDKVTNQIVSLLSIHPKIEVVDSEGKRAVVVTVDESPYVLISYKGQYWERVGATDRRMSQARLRERLIRTKTWDALPTQCPVDEIDDGAISRFINEAVGKERLPRESLSENYETLLEKLNLLVDGKLTNGALLLFGKNPQKYYVNLTIRLGRFKTATEIIDDQWADGNVFHQLERALTVLQQYVSVRYRIETIEREDVREYPFPALREAVVNALMHRDYFDIANFIQINAYDDHLWISNPGGLPDGLTVEDLKRDHKSIGRNPLIARVLRLAGYAEEYGTGTLRMVEEMKRAGLPEPEFREEMGGFSVYLYKDIYTEEKLSELGLSERQIAGVLQTKKLGRITNKKYRELTGLSDEGARTDLGDLVRRGLLESRGKGRSAHYVLVLRQS
jgi:ATP-dependent DNA helicase RecG